MSYAHFVCDTDDFVDPPDILAQNINGIAGHALESFLSWSLRDNAINASACFAEDHGWDFSVEHGGAKYHCACSLEGERPAEAQVTIGKSRSLMDRITGRNKLDTEDAVVAAIRKALSSHSGVRNLRED